jgi:hypothetical protein
VVLPRGEAHILASGAGAQLIHTSALLPEVLKGAVLSERGPAAGS